MKKKILCLIITLTLVISFVPSVFANKIHDIYDNVFFADYDACSITSVGLTGEGALKDLKSANVVFKNVNFGDKTPLKVEVVAGCGGGQKVKLQFRLDSPSGEQLFELRLDDTGWANYTYEIFLDDVNVTGKHDLYVVNTLNGTGNLLSFKFTKPPEKVAAFPEYPKKDFYNDIADSKYREKINLIGALGLIDEFDNGVYNPELGVTRGEFARAIYKLISDEKGEGVAYDPFTDVPRDAIFAEAVNDLKERGIITGRDDNTYKPYDFISVEDATVIVCRMLGYEPIASVGGGYIDGYMAIAAEEKLLKGVDLDGKLQRDSFAQLIYNAIHADYMSFNSVSSNKGLNYSKITGILSETKDIYYSTLYIDETSYTGIFSPVSTLPENSIRSGNDVYFAGESGAEAFLGMTCECYWQDVDGERHIIYISPKRTDNVYYAATWDGNEIEIDENQVTVHQNDKKTKVKDITDFVVIYNGKSLDSSFLTTVTAPFKGSVRIVEGEKTPIVFIEQYKDIVLGTIDKFNHKFYNRLSNEEADIDKYINAYEAELSISLNNSPVSIDRLTAGMSGSFYESTNTNGKKLIRLLLNDEEISGTITKLSNEEIDIDYVTYKSAGNLPATLQLGASGVFLVNAYGEVIYVDAKGASDFKIGIFVNSIPVPEDERFILSIVDEYGELVKFDCAETITADGVRVKDILDLEDGIGAFKGFQQLKTDDANDGERSVILYKTNSKGLITAVDTRLKGTGKVNDSLRLTARESKNNNCYYNNTGSVITISDRAAYPLSKNTILITHLPEVDDEKYTFSSLSSLNTGSKISLTIYSTVADSIINDIVLYGNASDYAVWESPMIYQDKSEALDKNDEHGYALVGYGNEGYSEYFVSDEITTKNVSVANFIGDVKKGDWVQVQTDSTGNVINAKILYTTSSQGLSTTPVLSSSTPINGSQSTGRYISGTVVNVEGDFVQVDTGIKETIQDENGNDKEVAVYEYINLGEGVISQWGITSRGIAFNKGLGKESVLIGKKIFAYIRSRRTVQVLINSL